MKFSMQLSLLYVPLNVTKNALKDLMAFEGVLYPIEGRGRQLFRFSLHESYQVIRSQTESEIILFSSETGISFDVHFFGIRARKKCIPIIRTVL